MFHSLDRIRVHVSVTAVINGHKEGFLLSKSIFSALAAKARCAFRVDIHIILDSPDAETLTVAHNFADSCQVSVVGFSDLGISRNYGATGALTEYVAFLDGDDLWSENWLVEAYLLSEEVKGAAVVHPELNVYFNDKFPSRLGAITRHIPSTSADFDQAVLTQANYWTALSFAPKRVFLSHPFRAVSSTLGNGFEDWTFNLETLIQGIDHVVAPKTAHFIRDKQTNSMRREHADRDAIFFPISL